MKYHLTILDKMATEDSYKHGEIGMGNNFYINETFKGDTIKEVIEKACDFVGGDYEGDEKCWSIDIDGDQGRIDFQTMETADAALPTKNEIEQWKKGDLKLYACYYVGIVEKVMPVNLKEEKL